MKRTPEQLLELAKELKIAEVNEFAELLFNQSIQGYSQWEAIAWPILREEAIQFQLDDTIGDYMALEIGNKYTSAADLAAIILGKADALKHLRAMIIMNRQDHEIAIDGLSTIEEVDGYDFSVGWK